MPGRVDAAHLYFPRAITFDDTGCLYIAMVPRQGWVGGALLRKYDPTGKKILWERQGLEFQEAADGDPGNDGVDVFTQTHRYTEFRVPGLKRVRFKYSEASQTCTIISPSLYAALNGVQDSIKKWRLFRAWSRLGGRQ